MMDGELHSYAKPIYLGSSRLGLWSSCQRRFSGGVTRQQKKENEDRIVTHIVHFIYLHCWQASFKAQRFSLLSETAADFVVYPTFSSNVRRNAFFLFKKKKKKKNTAFFHEIEYRIESLCVEHDVRTRVLLLQTALGHERQFEKFALHRPKTDAINKTPSRSMCWEWNESTLINKYCFG
jgi:hypothetical protein